MRYVLIGNSIATIGAIEAIRKNDKAGQIIVIGSEKHHVYGRPLISYMLMGKTTKEKMLYRDEEFYKINRCELHLGRTVTKIDKDKKEVLLDNDDRIAYDKLLVATGSRTFIPPTKGIETVKNVFNFITLDDALGIEKVISKDKKVLIVGAGLIGLKCAEGIADKVKEITVIDMAKHVLSSILDGECAAKVQKKIEEHNVNFLLDNHVTEFDGNAAYLADREILQFDILVMAAGVRPNTSLIEDIDGEVNRGIIVNNMMQTSIEDIYCAGDCSRGYDLSINDTRILALLPNAYMQGECAGYNMSGNPTEFIKGMPMNSIGFWDFHIATAGSYEGEYIELIDEEGNIKRLYIKDNVLKGFMMIGKIDKAGIYTSLVREQTLLSDIDFEMISKEPCLMAFTKENREEKMGTPH